MTGAEKIVAAIVIALIVLTSVLSAEVVELALIVQVIVLGAIALVAGGYIWLSNRGLTKAQSEYLWLLVKRDLRVMFGLVGLAGLAVVVLGPRLDWFPDLIQRPWGTLWLVIAVDLFAVGLIDDALVVHRDKAIGRDGAAE